MASPLTCTELFPLSSCIVTEARSHGVGYYGFSQDEARRHVQQDALFKLRQETQREQVAAQGLRDRRQQQLQARLKAARQRKRARLGLPPEEDGTISTLHWLWDPRSENLFLHFPLMNASSSELRGSRIPRSFVSARKNKVYGLCPSSSVFFKHDVSETGIVSISR
jgi:hypothetical protein